MPYFPMFVNLETKKIIVVGGGKTALRKINSLLYFGAKIAVIAPRICDEIKQIRGINIHENNLTLEVLDNADIVVAATRRPEINEKIGNYCNEKKIPVNVSDNKALSSFLFPGVVVRDDLVVGITTGGNSTNVSKQIKNMIDRMIPAEYGTLTKKMAAYTELATINIKDAALRDAALDELVKTAINNKCVLDDKKANKILDKYYKMAH
ncbi:MAG: bifunctional precorrin-2 dehydrogenase/sirohydrochlorin ferrochelatase [Coprococcus sp.]